MYIDNILIFHEKWKKNKTNEANYKNIKLEHENGICHWKLCNSDNMK